MNLISCIHHTLLESSEGLNANTLEKFTEAIDMFVQIFSRVDKQNENKVLDSTFDASTDLFEPTDIAHIYYISRRVLEIIQTTICNVTIYDHDSMFSCYVHGLCYKEILNIRVDELMKFEVFIVITLLDILINRVDDPMGRCYTEFENVLKISIKFLELSLPSNRRHMHTPSAMKTRFVCSRYQMQEEFTEEETHLDDGLENEIAKNEVVENEVVKNFIRNTKEMTAYNKETWREVLYSVKRPEEFRTKFADGTCCICLGVLNVDFSLLICQHAFCTSCLENLSNTQPKLVSSVYILPTKSLSATI